MCQNGLTVYIDFHVVIYLSLVTNALHRAGCSVTVTTLGHKDCLPGPSGALCPCRLPLQPRVFHALFAPQINAGL